MMAERMRLNFDKDAASVASRPVSQNGGSNCSREEATDILSLRLQLELARVEDRKIQADKETLQAEREMMRERVKGRRDDRCWCVCCKVST